MLSRLVLLVLLSLAAGLVIATVVRGRSVDVRRDTAWLAGTWLVRSDEAEVYVRYLARVRAHRRIGGMFGVLFAVVVGIGYGGTIAIGLGATGPLGDVLFCGVAGVLVGAMSAEAYRLSLPPAPQATSASLAPRPALPGARLVVAARVLVGLATGAGVVLATAGDDQDALVAAVLGVLLVVVCEATRTAVARRRRAALSERALVVDGNLRAFAGRKTAWLELTAGTLAATWAVSALGVVGWLPDPFGTVLSLGGLVTAVVFLAKASPRPPRSFSRADPVPLAGTVPLA